MVQQDVSNVVRSIVVVQYLPHGTLSPTRTPDGIFKSKSSTPPLPFLPPLEVGRPVLPPPRSPPSTLHSALAHAFLSTTKPAPHVISKLSAASPVTVIRTDMSAPRVSAFPLPLPRVLPRRGVSSPPPPPPSRVPAPRLEIQVLVLVVIMITVDLGPTSRFFSYPSFSSSPSPSPSPSPCSSP